MTLTFSQSQVIESILGNYKQNRNSKHAYRIQGEAGTGKTYTVAHLIFKYLLTHQHKKVLVVCISHQALNNFINAVKQVDKKLYELYTRTGRLLFRTIASALKQYKVGWSGFSKPDSTGLKPYDFIVVDEFSNVGQNKTEKIIEGLHNTAHCLFCGDYMQLPPVKDRVSDVAKIRDTGTHSILGLPLESYTLTEQMRQPGILARISKEARGKVYVPEPNDYLLRQFSDEDLQKVWFYRNEKQFTQSALHHIMLYGAENCVVINWRNSEVDRIGTAIRNQLLGKEAEGSLFVNKEVMRVFKGNSRYDKGTTVKIRLHWIENYQGINVCLSYDEHTGRMFRLVHRRQEAALNRLMKFHEMMWQSNRDPVSKEVLDYFDDAAIVGYAYSVTAHSCQGVTVPYVFINTPDLIQCTAKKSILMVGYSRASEKLHFLRRS